MACEVNLEGTEGGGIADIKDNAAAIEVTMRVVEEEKTTIGSMTKGKEGS